MGKIKSYSKEFKFKVALEMVRGDLTIAEITSKYQVPKSVLSKWKKQLLDNGSEVFSRAKTPFSGDSNNSAEIDKLHQAIGKLKVENDFLQRCSTRLNM
jgi:transposase